MGSFRFIFAFSTSLLIQAATIGLVAYFGNDAAAWRTVAIIYTIIGVITNSISVFSVKELSEEELREEDGTTESAVDEKYSLIDAAKLLVANKYYIMICATYILQQLYSAMLGVGTFYMKYVMGNENFPHILHGQSIFRLLLHLLSHHPLFKNGRECIN